MPANAPPRLDVLSPIAASSPSWRALVALTFCVWIGLVVVRWTAPSDLMARDQERVGTYVLDIVHNGNLLVQHDVEGHVASKPPIFNWIAGTATYLAGGLSRFTLAFPSVLASLGSMLVLLVVGARRFGPAAALWVVPLFAFCQLGLRLVFLARSDEVFAFFTLLAAVAAVRAWERGAGWTWFWLAASGATMTKGPHGVLFAGVGLLAAFWEKRSGAPLSLRGRHWTGLALFFAIPLAWLLAAWLSVGWPVLQKLFVDELGAHALGVGSEKNAPGVKFFHPWAWFATRMAPMSLVAAVGMWRVVRRPAAAPEERRFERFLLCWLVGGLLLLALQSTIRFIHLVPMMPPAALLASRELARWLGGVRPALTRTIAFATTGLALVGSWFYLDVIDAKDPRIVLSEGVRVAAEDIAAQFARDRLEFVDAPMALQVHLDVFRSVLDVAAANARLAAAAPVLVVTLARNGQPAVASPQVHARYALPDGTELLVVGNTVEPPRPAGWQPGGRRSGG